jgi:hypothetical protein
MAGIIKSKLKTKNEKVKMEGASFGGLFKRVRGRVGFKAANLSIFLLF